MLIQRIVYSTIFGVVALVPAALFRLFSDLDPEGIAMEIWALSIFVFIFSLCLMMWVFHPRMYGRGYVVHPWSLQYRGTMALGSACIAVAGFLQPLHVHFVVIGLCTVLGFVGCIWSIWVGPVYGWSARYTEWAEE